MTTFRKILMITIAALILVLVFAELGLMAPMMSVTETFRGILMITIVALILVLVFSEFDSVAPSASIMVTFRKIVVMIMGALILMSVIGDVYLVVPHYMELPRQANPTAGRIIPYVIKNRVVFLTKQEKDWLIVLYWGRAALFAIGIALYLKDHPFTPLQRRR
ncbi:MAG: hypothetical protein ACYDDO_15280 [Acidiferrobacterales bacterium]